MSTFQKSPLNDLLTDELLVLINQANLGEENKKIAKMALIEQKFHEDIAAEMGYSRSTISKRTAKIIQRLEQIAKKTNILPDSTLF